MKNKAFTLIEIVIALVIIGVLATLGFPAYQNAIEDSRARVCETNLRALKTALDIYAIEHDTMPGGLGQLPQEYIQRGYAQVMQRPDAWKTKLASAILEWSERSLAYAAENFLFVLAKGNIGVVTCPSVGPQDRPHVGAGTNEIINPNYGMNSLILLPGGNPISSSAYRALGGGIPLIGDCNSATFTDISQLAQRHSYPGFLTPSKTYAIYITQNLDETIDTHKYPY